MRRIALTLALTVAAWVGAAERPFDFEALRSRARDLAARPHAPGKGEVPAWLRALTYDDLRRIRFDETKSLWRGDGLKFQAQFFHPGFVHGRSVRLSETRAGRTEPVAFRREYFDYGGLKTGEIPETMGFAGFRLLHPFGGEGAPWGEAGAFLGASYFRFLPAEATYGLSARGLAIDTAEPGPEEFPAFTEFWLERPAPGANEISVLALLESESATGAYRFSIAPGAVTTMRVKAAVFFRKTVKVLGVAPLTSMFWRGENWRGVVEDYRPEVHDSDGLLMHTGAGEWIWRPLDNPRGVRVAAFGDENPRGFGLLQRDRDFEHYQDLEAHYHARPSAWVEPEGRWGRGSVRLVELPTQDEFNDNIVAFWTPEKQPPLGEALEVEYRIRWAMGQIAPPAGFTRATRTGKGAAYEPGLERIVVDFEGEKLRRLRESESVEPAITVGEGAKLHHAIAQKNPHNGTWRVAFTLRPDGSGRPVELRCFLRHETQALTETWSHLWQP